MRKVASHFAEALHALIVDSGVFDQRTWCGTLLPPNSNEDDLAKGKVHMERWFFDEELPTPDVLRKILYCASNVEKIIAEWLMCAEGDFLKRVIATRDRWKLGKYRHAFEEAHQSLLRAMNRPSTPLVEEMATAVPGARTLAEYAYLPVYLEALFAGLAGRSTEQLVAGTNDFAEFVRQRLMHEAQK